MRLARLGDFFLPCPGPAEQLMRRARINIDHESGVVKKLATFFGRIVRATRKTQGGAVTSQRQVVS
jgi:hypothetical protein